MKTYPAVFWLSVLSALLGSFQFGYHLGVLNTCLKWVAEDLNFDKTTDGSIVVSAALVGAAVGALIAGQLADRYGPQKALATNNTFLVVGCVLIAWAPGGLWAAVIGRFLAGFGAGAASLYVPRYLAEISPVAIRGGIATLNQVFICLGILIAYVVGLPYISKEPAKLQLGSKSLAWWRVMQIIGIIPAASQMISLSFLPESPMWLRWKGKVSEANASQAKLVGAPAGDDEVNEELTLVSAESAELDSEMDGEVTDSSEKGWGELLSSRYRWIMLLTSFLPLFQQLSGINTCILYSTEVFKDAGLKQPVFGSIIMGCINLASTILAVFLMDKAGRRLLILLSHAGMGACLLIIAIVSFIPSMENATTIVSVVMLQIFVLFFGLGAGPIPWIYLPEILPAEIKGRGASLGTCINWVATFLVGLTFPYMLKGLKVGGSYLVYAVLNIVALIFCIVYMVETKQRSLAQIQKTLKRS